MELFQLLGTIAINSNGANETITGVTTKAKGLGDKLQTVGSKATSLGNKLSKYVTLPAAAAGGAILAFANKSASAGDRVDKMSQKIGISRKAFQELDFICSQSGTSVDTLQMGLKTLTNQMQSAAGGGKTATAAFKKLGISIYDSSGQLKSQEDMMWEAMTALQGMENQTEKAALATDLFGRSGSELMPLLNGTSGSIEEMKKKAHELGLVMSDDAVDSSVVFSDTLDQLKRSLGAAAIKAGTALLPILTELTQAFINKGVPAIQKFSEKVQAAIDWFSGLNSGTKKVIGTLAALVVGIGPVLSIGGLLISTVGKIVNVGKILITVVGGISAPMLAVVAAVTAVIAIGVSLYKNWDKIKEKCGQLKTAVVNKFDSLKTGAINKITSLKSSAIGKFNDIKKGITDKIDGAKDKVKTAIDKIKGFFNFKVSLPHIKLPHFSIQPSGWQLGDLLKGKIPSLGIDWYKKAMDNPMLMTSPTIFGYNSATGQFMGGGEAGSEVVSGTNTLMNMISDAVGSRNEALIYYLQQLVQMLAEYFPQVLSSMDRQLVLDTGILAGEMAVPMDKALGKLKERKDRGR